jgi:hypothetical protein
MVKSFNAVPLRKKPLGLLKLLGYFILTLFLLKLLFGIGTIVISLLAGTIFGFILGRKF